MWICIVFLTYLTPHNSLYDPPESKIIGSYMSESACMSAGQAWVNAHKQNKIQAEFSCERDIKQGVEI
jgi:hypothetical protein